MQALIFKATDQVENQEYGNEVSRLRAAMGYCEKLRKDLKNVFPDMYEALTREEESVR